MSNTGEYLFTSIGNPFLCIKTEMNTFEQKKPIIYALNPWGYVNIVKVPLATKVAFIATRVEKRTALEAVSGIMRTNNGRQRELGNGMEKKGRKFLHIIGNCIASKRNNELQRDLRANPHSVKDADMVNFSVHWIYITIRNLARWFSALIAIGLLPTIESQRLHSKRGA